MSKKFTKLFLGDVVHTVGSRVFRKLSTEQPVVEDELQGTWVINNDRFKFPSEGAGDTEYMVNITIDNVDYIKLYFWRMTALEDADDGFVVVYDVANVRKEIYGYDPYTHEVFDCWYKPEYKTWHITSKLSEVENGAELLAWLKTNATKQVTSTQPISLSINDATLTIQDNDGIATQYDILVDGVLKQTVNSDTNIINFTIEGVQYQAEETMHWSEWVESDYNTNGFYITENSKYGYVYSTAGSEPRYLGKTAKPIDLIIGNANYTLYYSGN